MNTRNLYDYTISEKTLINNPVFSHRQICVYQKSYMTFERLYTCFRTLSELFPYSHPRACFYYCYSHPRVQRVLDIHRFPGQASSPSVIADLIFLTVIPRLNRGIQEIPGSRYACPRMTEEKYCHSCTLLLSSVIPVLGTGICKGDARVKPEHDVFLYVMSGSSPNMTKKNKAGHDK